jgi:hypothetical protein
MMAQFDNFKDRKPEPQEVLISKFNSASLKTIYKKYLCYIRYLVYTQTNSLYDYSSRFDAHMTILSCEQHLIDVFKLFIMSFDDKNAQFSQLEGAYFREFKKAYL